MCGLRAAHRGVDKAEESPALGHVHVNEACGAPHPVLLGLAGNEPFNAREVDAPCLERARIGEVAGEGLEGYGHLHIPCFVGVGGFVECSVHPGGKLESLAVPRHEEAASRAVRLVEHEVEHHALGVVLDFEIVLTVAVGVDEHLEVIVVVYDGVALRELCYHVVLHEAGAYVKVFVVPHHLGPCGFHGFGISLAADVDERLCRDCLGPVGLVEFAVDFNFSRGAECVVEAGFGKTGLIFVDKRCGCPGSGGYGCSERCREYSFHGWLFFLFVF